MASVSIMSCYHLALEILMYREGIFLIILQTHKFFYNSVKYLSIEYVSTSNFDKMCVPIIYVYISPAKKNNKKTL